MIEGSDDRDLTVDADDDDWAWRRRIRSSPLLATPYRVLVFVIGLVLVLGGLALVPLPGPGWLVVILGLVVWASEFSLAQRVLDWVKAKVNAWQHWILAQSLWVRCLAALATFAFVLAVAWVLLRVSGVPAFLPDGLEQWLHDVARLP